MFSALNVLLLALLAGTVLALGRFVPGVRVQSKWGAVAVAAVFIFLDWALGYVLRVVLFVPALLTLGLLFLFIPFIVSTVALWATDKMFDVIDIADARALLISSGVLTLVSGAFHLISGR